MERGKPDFLRLGNGPTKTSLVRALFLDDVHRSFFCAQLNCLIRSQSETCR